ncbi:NAD-dependent epimerase/dehydratase family protein [Variovorax sp. JS1663]|uniref:NAD-dependent epimerase/dehydratase family protein n=1 Tax=Variovorax sp. JS1663 TaxID=1851577 RepID=UPI000B345F39|nr:NAD(P)-dependent oxidoreductase [Variovorax sp. JS1663]OUM02156.1 dTDP-glucose 4,6-dehydratase [Variovorax sp. JS1663]
MSEKKIFLAGATGAVGSVLGPLLVDAGYTVYGSTRRAERAQALEAQGMAPVVVDVFDAPALAQALKRIAPDAVMHQLTDLPQKLDPAAMADAVPRNARVRSEGTRNLVAAALASGCGRMVAQSIGWAYAPGPKPWREAQRLDLTAADPRGISVRGVAALEALTLATPGLAGTVLRYGQLYGPRTATPTPKGASPVHVEAAAWAALLALQRGAVGVFNIAEEGPELDCEKARRDLGWHAGLRWPAEVLA